MTTRVTIKNNDNSPETVVVTTTSNETHVLRAGEEIELIVYEGEHLTVKEGDIPAENGE